MVPLAGRATAQRAAELDQRGQGHGRGVHQFEAGARLAPGHPFRDDEPDAVRSRAEQCALSAERGGVLALDLERLPMEPMPRIVDGNRA
jgi:hypothetical protein